MKPFLRWPSGTDLVLRNATVPACLLQGYTGELVTIDLRIADRRIAEIGYDLAGTTSEIDLDGSLVFPGFSDLHTHIDKGHIWSRARNPDGTHGAAWSAVKADREANWSAADVAARADFALRCAYAHGTVALRTHLDTVGEQLDISWPVFTELRDRWAGRIALQAVALLPLEAYATSFADRTADVVARSGGMLGGFCAMQPDAAALIARVFDLAMRHDLDLDLHVDETGDAAARTLRLVAQAAIERGYQGRVTCGHCCSLAAQEAGEAGETIALVARAGITVVSLPMVNLYLQGRMPGTTPRWRGVTLLHELRAAGVRVAIASDNTRDPFYRFGDLDMVEVLREGVRIAHLDTPVGDWPRAATVTPWDVMGLPADAPGGELRAGGPADLVIFNARNDSELLSRPQSDRIVLRSGRPINTTLPSYRELDPLFG